MVSNLPNGTLPDNPRKHVMAYSFNLTGLSIASFFALFFWRAAWAAAADILLAGYGLGAASRGAALAGYWLRCWVLPRGSRRAASLLFPAQTDDE